MVNNWETMTPSQNLTAFLTNLGTVYYIITLLCMWEVFGDDIRTQT